MTTTPNLPVPKYQVGEKLWTPYVRTERHDAPCPDCRGSKLWRAVSPAGTELDMTCPRCAGYSRGDFPDWRIEVAVASAEPRVISDVIVRAVGGPYDRQIEYRAKVPGGGDYCLAEEELYRDLDAALAVATERAVVRQRELNQKPEQRQVELLSVFELRDAAINQSRSKVYDAYWRYRDLRERVEELLETAKNTKEKDVPVEGLTAALDYDDVLGAHEGLRPMFVLFETLLDEEKLAVTPRAKLRELAEKVWPGEPKP